MIGTVSQEQVVREALRRVGLAVIAAPLINVRSGQRWLHRRVIVPIGERLAPTEGGIPESCSQSSNVVGIRSEYPGQGSFKRLELGIEGLGVIDPVNNRLVVHAQMLRDLPEAHSVSVVKSQCLIDKHVAVAAYLRQRCVFPATLSTPETLRAGCGSSDFVLPLSCPAARAGG